MNEMMVIVSRILKKTCMSNTFVFTVKLVTDNFSIEFGVVRHRLLKLLQVLGVL